MALCCSGWIEVAAAGLLLVQETCFANAAGVAEAALVEGVLAVYRPVLPATLIVQGKAVEQRLPRASMRTPPVQRGQTQPG